MKTPPKEFWGLVGSLVLVVAILVFCYGCAAESGNITDKTWAPAWDSYGSTCVSYNQNGTCNFSVPQIYHHPEQYCFELDGGTWDRCVPKDMWNKYKIGDYFPGVDNG
jgi:hypothetical protein